MAKIGDFSYLNQGNDGNLFRDIQNTKLQERFKQNEDGSIGYRVDIKGVNPQSKLSGGHLTYINNIFDKK